MSHAVASRPTETGSASQVSPLVWARLSLMMFLQFFVPGTFTATLGLILVSHGLPGIVGVVFTLTAIAAVAAPMGFGAVSDRVLPAQVVLGGSHLIAALVMFAMPGAIAAQNSALVLVLIFVFKVFYQPTPGLANAIALRSIGEKRDLFPFVRVLGTVGWIVGGLTVGALGLSKSTTTLYLTAGSGILFGLFALTLPNTRPENKGGKFEIKDAIGWRATALLRDRNFATFLVCATATGLSLGTYNAYGSTFLSALGIANVAGVMTIGQMSEIAFIVVLPLLLRRVGMKWTLAVGIGMWAVRFALFAAAGLFAGQWMAIAAVALHGICNDFVVIAGSIYVDRIAPVSLAAQGQSLLVIAVQGVGAALGSLIGGWIFARTVGAQSGATPSDWWVMWVIPMGVSAVAMIWWMIFFSSRQNRGAPSTPAVDM